MADDSQHFEQPPAKQVVVEKKKIFITQEERERRKRVLFDKARPALDAKRKRDAELKRARREAALEEEEAELARYHQKQVAELQGKLGANVEKVVENAHAHAVEKKEPVEKKKKKVVVRSPSASSDSESEYIQRPCTLTPPPSPKAKAPKKNKPAVAAPPSHFRFHDGRSPQRAAAAAAVPPKAQPVVFKSYQAFDL